mgnify:CR=1 FL=1
MSRQYEAPVGEVETVLARVWQEVLRIERVGRHDNFFELGGHSLLDLRLITRVSATFNIPLTILAVFQFPTVMKMSKKIEELLQLKCEEFLV